MKKLNIFSAILFVCLIIPGILLNSCKEDETDDTIKLLSWGPSPALRGGELRFIGKNLDKVSEVILPVDISVTTFKTKTPELLVIDVPMETMEGEIKLIIPGGEIVPLTMLGISEPIVLDTIIPSTARPGDTVTIHGEYLNLIKEVIFSVKKSDTVFISQSAGEIQLVVPVDAQTGIVTLSNREEEPILIESTSPFNVMLPVVTSMTPNPVKAGANLTITGTNLDLATKIMFGGDKPTTTFVSQSKTSIVVAVPADAADGVIKLIAASFVESPSADELTMVIPVITSITPNPAKNSGMITVNGSNLDVITSVTFGGEVDGTIQAGGSATQITVQVPAEATEGIVNFNTAAGKTVASASALNLTDPVITSISPLSTAAHQTITITGTDLDVVAKIVYTGGYEATPEAGGSDTEISFVVTPGARTGKVTLVTTNGTEIESDDDLTVVANVPVINSLPSVGVGELLEIKGTNMTVFADIIFPGDKKATMYGIKNDTMIQVYVPGDATKGHGTLSFITSDNEVLEEDIYIMEDIAQYIYDDALVTGWQQWGGWSVTSQDWANTEMPKAGTKSIKVDFAGNWGAIQAHPTDPAVFGTYTTVKLSIYGTPGTTGSLQLYIKDNTDNSLTPVELPLSEGWVNYTITMEELGNPPSVKEFVIQDKGADVTVYIDEIGLM